MDLERWENLSRRDQLGHISAEILRANLMGNKNESIYFQILERAINLIDISFSDAKWQKNPLPLLILRDELSKAYIDKNVNLDKICKAL